jgi:murein DD-endopeptidase MepM/ murein hydrolase activator NlpD
MFKILALLAALSNPIEATGDYTQGGLVIVHVPQGAQLTVDNAMYYHYDNRYFIGFARDAAPVSVVTIKLADGSIQQYKMDIAQKHYQNQAIKNVSKEITEPNTANQKRIAKEAVTVASLKAEGSDECPQEFHFSAPHNGRISGVFGSQRTYNGKPGAPHSGIDFEGNLGDPILAPEAGKVIMIEDLFVSGKTMLVDHGCGLISSFLHLDSTDRKVGDYLKKGDVLGKAGKSGLATGPHLHWGINLGSVRLDPLLLLE